MKCFVCGEDMQKIVTDLPFKTGLTTIVIIKQLPVWQCPNCAEYLLEDALVEKIDRLLMQADERVELEIMNWAVGRKMAMAV